MSHTIIRVENIGKKYILNKQQQGSYRYKALRDEIADGVKSLGRKLLNPFDKSVTKPTREEFWALKDVSFEIKQGDRVGIIGGNGAGKSTLLKILSRITEPTTGRISIKGRIASLLEVGTGFHPELTGRENIFLNGAILGMTKFEIKNKFDEIVAFAEVEKFLDTPVKHYSSGMYVRLAFAVAAHLEPEILIVDEVLAVGDVQFQKKCLGKMEDVSKGGRTIFFVSHNMAIIRAICNQGILMKNGELAIKGNIENVISHYITDNTTSDAVIAWAPDTAPQSPEIRFLKAYILNENKEYASVLDFRKEFSIVIVYELLKPITGLRTGFFIQNIEGITLCASNDPHIDINSVIAPGCYISQCTVPGYILNAGRYSISFSTDAIPYPGILVNTSYCLSFTIEDVEGHGVLHERLPGVLRPKLTWSKRESIK
jgi:lipopolysaccharide transport system ATP-binding protein